ncbi:hypothetical protein IAR50_007418 [Cryptococcus sp. DSM 104548]
MGTSLSISDLATTCNTHSNTSRQSTTSLNSHSSLLSSVSSSSSSTIPALSYKVTLSALPRLIKSVEEIGKVSVVAKVVNSLTAASCGLSDGKQSPLRFVKLIEDASQEQKQDLHQVPSEIDKITPRLHAGAHRPRSPVSHPTPSTPPPRPNTSPNTAGAHTQDPFQCSSPKALRAYNPRASIQRLQSLPATPRLDSIDGVKEVAAIVSLIMDEEFSEGSRGGGEKEYMRAAVLEVTPDSSTIDHIFSDTDGMTTSHILVSYNQLQPKPPNEYTIPALLTSSDSLESLYSYYALIDFEQPLGTTNEPTTEREVLGGMDTAQDAFKTVTVFETPGKRTRSVTSQEQQSNVTDLDNSSSSLSTPTIQTPKTPPTSLPIPSITITPDSSAPYSSEVDYLTCNARFSHRLPPSAFESPIKRAGLGSGKDAMLKVPKKGKKMKGRGSTRNQKKQKAMGRRSRCGNVEDIQCVVHTGSAGQ